MERRSHLRVASAGAARLCGLAGSGRRELRLGSCGVPARRQHTAENSGAMYSLGARVHSACSKGGRRALALQSRVEFAFNRAWSAFSMSSSSPFFTLRRVEVAPSREPRKWIFGHRRFLALAGVLCRPPLWRCHSNAAANPLDALALPFERRCKPSRCSCAAIRTPLQTLSVPLRCHSNATANPLGALALPFECHCKASRCLCAAIRMPLQTLSVPLRCHSNAAAKALGALALPFECHAGGRRPSASGFAATAGYPRGYASIRWATRIRGDPSPVASVDRPRLFGSRQLQTGPRGAAALARSVL